jgi:hypothetical protein
MIYHNELEKKLVIESILSFEGKANDMIKQLAQEHDLDLNNPHPFGKLLTRSNNLWKGKLENNWNYKFHGSGCDFENSLTGQFLYVKTSIPGEYGVIDDYYLYKYIQTTDSLRHICDTIKSEKHFYQIIKELENESTLIYIGEIYEYRRILNRKLFTR